MPLFKRGDYVMYEPGYKSELGRVTSTNIQTGNAFVCFTEGCTAACTSMVDLRLAAPEEVEANTVRFGYHRFDGSCPDYSDVICYADCHPDYEEGYSGCLDYMAACDWDWDEADVELENMEQGLQPIDPADMHDTLSQPEELSRAFVLGWRQALADTVE